MAYVDPQVIVRDNRIQLATKDITERYSDAILSSDFTLSTRECSLSMTWLNQTSGRRLGKDTAVFRVSPYNDSNNPLQ